MNGHPKRICPVAHAPLVFPIERNIKQPKDDISLRLCKYLVAGWRRVERPRVFRR